MKNKYSRVFIGNSAYALFNYLLVSTREEIEDTFFFFSYSIPRSCANYFRSQSVSLFPKKNKISDELYSIYIHFFGEHKWRFLNSARLYGMLDGPFVVELIGKRKINVIEEGCEYLDVNRPKRLFRGLRRLLHGHFYNHVDYEDSHVETIYLSGLDKDAPVMRLPKVILFDLFEEWKRDESRRKLILECFGLTDDDISGLSACKTLLISQTFSEDGVMGLDEEIQIYKTLLSGVDSRTLCIKTHPREYLKDYSKIFPSSFSFRKKIPLQLMMCCMDFGKFDTVYTVISTAARTLKQFCPGLHIVFAGSGVHPNISKRYGNVEL